MHIGLVLDTSSSHSISSKSHDNLLWDLLLVLPPLIQHLVVLVWESVKRFSVPVIDMLLFESILYEPFPSITVSWAKFIRVSEFIFPISCNFYILLVSLRETNPESFILIPLFVQILWTLEYFRVCLIFPVKFSNFLRFFNFGKQFSEILKFTKPRKIFRYIYARVTLGNSFRIMKFLMVSKN